VKSIKSYFLLLVSLLVPIWAGYARAEVTYSGLTPAQEVNARAVMPLASTGCDSAIWRVRRLFRDADTNLRRSLEALGYYDVAVSKSLTTDSECWAANFDVTVGSPVILREVDVQIDGEAAGDPQYQSRILTGRPVTGDILNHGHYDQFKSTLLGAAISGGYFDAELVRSEVLVDPDAYAADVHLNIRSGPRYRFGEINFSQGILRDSLLFGFTDIETGDHYDSVIINKLYDTLNGSTYFKTVSISTEPIDKENKTAPVNISLTPGARRVYSIGAGFATDTGPKGRLGYANRRRNDRGHQLESKLNASPVDSELTVAYRWPIRDPRNEWFSVGLGLRHENTDTSENDTFKLGVLRSHNTSNSWLQTRYVDYSFENFKVGDQDTSSVLVIFGINWEVTKGRELSRTRNGRHLNFDIRGASDALGSDTNFAQFRSTAKWIHSINDKMRVLARGTLGSTLKDELSELPASVRFFAGGDRSIRGYDYESLGPVDESGVVIGASNLLTGSVEVDRLFKQHWSVAAFFDSGSAFNGTNIELSSGVGIGLRWYSPVGPVRLDFAHPLDDPDSNFRIHISLGPDL
jgi:translocation and assembly module TamA